MVNEVSDESREVQAILPEGQDASKAPERPPLKLIGHIRHLVINRVLKLNDTPHRIALGVFLGFVIGATPTVGFQMIFYFTVAALVGANKVSGILPVWLSNPITVVPLYYGNWVLGRLVMTGSLDHGGAADITALLEASDSSGGGLAALVTKEGWSQLFEILIKMGAELWVGSLLVGLVLGLIGYWATLRGVTRFRNRKSASAR